MSKIYIIRVNRACCRLEVWSRQMAATLLSLWRLTSCIWKWVWSVGRITLAGGNRSIWRKIGLTATLCTTNLT